MIDAGLKEQLKEIFEPLSSNYTLLVSTNAHPKSDEMVRFLSDFAECSPKIECSVENGEELGFTILKDGEQSGISFRAIPNGHEFTSLILAVMNLDGKGKNLPDEFTIKRITSLKGEINLTTYMSLTCTNCPDVVQSLNLMAIYNSNLTHTAVDGAIYKEEVEGLGIQSVPTVYAEGEQLHVGRGSIAELLDKLESKYGAEQSGEAITRNYDATILGAGPAGSTAAIYLARKGLKVAVVATRIGGQVNETSSIENIPSIIETTGTELAGALKRHMVESSVELLDNRTVESVEIDSEVKRLHIKGGEIIESPSLVVATGAEWRRLGIEGESEHIGRGVAFCPHCDGPLFKGKKVAVIGGGNSGVEAAIELASICSEVIVYEFMESLKADEVLQTKLRSLSNVTIFTNHETTHIVGDGSKIVAIEVRDRSNSESQRVELDGLFILIGLLPNTTLLRDKLDLNARGEIVVDRDGRTSIEGVYAAGDVTDVTYKQIVISMGEGAKAALALFDDSLRR